MTTIATLPPEIVLLVLAHLDDRDFVACLKAARLFHVVVSGSRVYETRRARWHGCITFEDFCRAGNVEAVDRLWRRRRPNDDQLRAAIHEAAAADRAGVVALLVEHDHSCLQYVLGCYDMLGPRMLAWLLRHHANALRPHADFILRHVVDSRLDAITLLDAAYNDLRFKGMMTSAAAAGHMDIVLYLHERHPESSGSRRCIEAAATNGDVDMVRFLCEYRDDGCNKHAITAAARGGHVEIMEMIKRRYPGVECLDEAMVWAIHNSDVACLEWLHQPGRAPCVPGLVGHWRLGACAESWLAAHPCACSAEAPYNWEFENLFDSEVMQEDESHISDARVVIDRRPRPFVVRTSSPKVFSF
jgi:hypothetical protein